jgi:hypothetical protein
LTPFVVRTSSSMRLCVQGVSFFLFTCFRVASVGFIRRKEDSLGESTVHFTRCRRTRSEVTFKRIVSDWPTGNHPYDIRECMGAFFCDEGRTPCSCHGFPCDSVILRGKANHVNFWEDLFNASGCFYPTEVRHLHIHHDDLRNEMQRYLDSGIPIGGFPYDLESRELAEQFAKGLPNRWKIICHDNSNRCLRAGCRHSQSNIQC